MATPIASTHSISHPIHHEILSLKRLLIWTFHTFWSNKKHKATPRAFIGPECFLLDQNVAPERSERRKCCVRKIQEKKSQRLERRKCCVTIDNKAFRERVLVAFWVAPINDCSFWWHLTNNIYFIFSTTLLKRIYVERDKGRILINSTLHRIRLMHKAWFKYRLSWKVKFALFWARCFKTGHLNPWGLNWEYYM